MWRLWLFVVALMIGYYFTQAEYEVVKKYYPDLTMWEYLMAGNKIRIIPKRLN